MAAQCFVCAQLLSRLFATSWTLAHQAPLFMGLSQQEYWSGLPFPPPGNLPNPGTEPRSPAFQVYSLPYEPPGKAFPTYKNEKKEIFRGKTYSTPVVY